MISNDRIFKSKYGLDAIASTRIDPRCKTIQVPCIYGSRLFWRICEFPGFAVFIEEGTA